MLLLALISTAALPLSATTTTAWIGREKLIMSKQQQKVLIDFCGVKLSDLLREVGERMVEKIAFSLCSPRKATVRYESMW